jgi:hypothetical protein
MFYALQRHHLLCGLSYVLAFASQDDHLQAVFVVQVDMQAGLNDAS